MRKVSLTAAVLFAVCCLVRAGEECDKARAEACEKVTKLLASWQAIAEAEKSGCPEERAKLNAEFAAIAKECPFGSRMEATLGFARSVLAAAAKAEAECAKACPLAKAEATAAATEAKPACAASELQAARGKLLKDLHQLVSFAAGAAPASGGCEKACAKEGATTTAAAPAALCEKKSAEILASVRKDACEKNAAATLMKEIAGLTCAEKAGKLAAAIRAEACEEKAGEILAKAATECCASAKEGTVATTAAPAAAKSALSEKKSAEVLASVRKDACEKNAAATLMKEIAGLTCAEKAGKLAAAIRAEACEEKAGEILAKAATECCASAKGTTVATAAGSEAKGDCCADLLACAKTLKASWEKAGGEFAGMCPQKKKELTIAFQTLQAKSKAVALMPETIMTISQGMAALDGMNGKMVELAKANPDMLKSIPEEAKKAFEGQCALVREASEVLTRVMAAMKGCEDAEKKGETTSAD
jgi:hypothetical protein